jgi:GNAT superfamily N-acetyltransferase
VQLRIVPEPLGSPVTVQLIAELDEELSLLYPEPGSTFFSLPEADVFVVAYDEHGRPLGCGAVRTVTGSKAPPGSERTAEVKRMYVRPDARGLGVGGAIVASLEGHARALGVERLVLETGARQHAAQAVYERAGFTSCACWGEYAHSPLSRCYAKLL